MRINISPGLNLKGFTLLLSLVYFGSLRAQSFSFKGREIATEEDLLHSCTFFFTYKKGLYRSTQSGTAYFYYSGLKSKLYLVSNMHLLDQIEKIGVFIALKDKNGKPDQSHIPQFFIETKDRLLSSPGLDLGLVDLSDYTDSLAKYYFRCYTESNMPSKKELSDFSLKDDLYCLGFPHAFFDFTTGLPVVLRATFASLPGSDFMGKKEFIINCSVRTGSSGSAIVFNKNSKYYLLGTARALEYGIEPLCVQTKKEPIPGEFDVQGIGRVKEVDSLSLDSGKAKLVIRDYFNVCNVIKSEVINVILSKK